MSLPEVDAGPVLSLVGVEGGIALVVTGLADQPAENTPVVPRVGDPGVSILLDGIVVQREPLVGLAGDRRGYSSSRGRRAVAGAGVVGEGKLRKQIYIPCDYLFTLHNG